MVTVGLTSKVTKSIRIYLAIKPTHFQNKLDHEKDRNFSFEWSYFLTPEFVKALAENDDSDNEEEGTANWVTVTNLSFGISSII